MPLYAFKILFKGLILKSLQIDISTLNAALSTVEILTKEVASFTCHSILPVIIEPRLTALVMSANPMIAFMLRHYCRRVFAGCP